MILGVKECVVTAAGYMSRTVTGKAAVKYSINEWAHPHPELSELGFGLFYHPDIGRAMRQGPTLNGNELLLCEVAGPLPLPAKILAFPENVYSEGPSQVLSDAEMRPEAGSAMACGLRPIVKVTDAHLVYKVVSEFSYSVMMKGAARVKYSVGKQSWAPKHLADIGMNIAAFSTLKDALYFKKMFVIEKCRIYEAIGLNESSPPVLIPVSSWAEYQDCDEQVKHPMLWPEGTRMYKSLIPVKEVVL